MSGRIPAVQTCLLDSPDAAILVWGRPLWGHSDVEWKSIGRRLTGSPMKFGCWLRLGGLKLLGLEVKLAPHFGAPWAEICHYGTPLLHYRQNPTSDQIATPQPRKD